MTLALNHKVHVLFRREDLDMVRLDGKVVIVLDILFATSTMIAALAQGAESVIPTLNESSAREAAKSMPPQSYILAGELYAETLPGFASPTPLALMQQPISGRTLIYSTTNGTVALQESSPAKHVYAGALLNARAVVRHIAREHSGETIIVVCSGSMGNPNLEDMYGAGYFVDLIGQEYGAQRDFFIFGDWDNSGIKRIGYFRSYQDQNGNPDYPSGWWFLDINGNNNLDNIYFPCQPDRCVSYGIAGDLPVVGLRGSWR